MAIRGVREPENIRNPMVGTSREEVESDWVGFPKKSRVTKISRTRLPILELQCCIAAYKIFKYTVQFLLSVKLLETRILRM